MTEEVASSVENLDNIDIQIEDLLQKDARIKVSDIARIVHLSITAVVRRIERLEDRGVIRGYRALLSAEKVGMNVHGFIVGGVYSVSLQELQRYIDSVPNIVRCETIISGGKEVLLEFYFRDLDELMRFYESDIRKYLDSMTAYLVKSFPLKDSSIPLSE